ncbi:hypothetical protein PORY_001683 [Pneumocystis oryctolagi]|uniref:Uncharacterized protein n=1 Tax=Pneumocystis oryctolagi TaxID=42067 RepID=A0ACB7CBQ9_9ASCO|nr:hypothetical protein PORY_001683 [Pneumocystis oryctolagi]
MSSESYYRSLKVPALKELLQKRSLMVTGKKEDMILRLLEFDKSDNKHNTTLSPRASKGDLGDLALPEDEIDWGDDTADITIKSTLFEKTPITNISDKLVNSKKKNDQNSFQKIQKEDSNFKFTSIASIFSISSESMNNTSIKKKTMLRNFPFNRKRNSETLFYEDKESIEHEIIKRKARASRFGIPENENNKRLERYVRFGTLPEKDLKNVKQNILDDSIKSKKGKEI